MIAALADDLTGAAEIAGIGWRHGLKPVILERDEAPVRTGLLVYHSDSRNCPDREARRRVKQILNRVRALSPKWIFQKVDSVLRGNVLVEIEAVLETLRWTGCLLVPANPSAGRTIHRGRYFIDGQPLSQTDFRHDPHHPRFSDKVIELLGEPQGLRITCRNPKTATLPRGIVVGDASTSPQMRQWSRRVDERTLPAGGAEFFQALLAVHGLKPVNAAGKPKRRTGGRALFVCGSLTLSAIQFLIRRRSEGWPVLLMPDELLHSSGMVEQQEKRWARRIATALEQHPRVAIGIGQPPLEGKRTPFRLGKLLTRTAARVMASAQPRSVCVEGGATAVLLMKQLGWSRLTVTREHSPGVVAVRSAGAGLVTLVLKPGSYKWPEELWRCGR